jgi:hypothetical protein
MDLCIEPSRNFLWSRWFLFDSAENRDLGLLLRILDGARVGYVEDGNARITVDVSAECERNKHCLNVGFRGCDAVLCGSC